MVNQVNLFGKIVSSEIELRKSKSGTSVTEFRIIHRNKKFKNPLFIDIEVWGQESIKVHDTAKKGDKVIVYGELRSDIWTSKDGTQKSKIKITANKVVVIPYNTENLDKENLVF